MLCISSKRVQVMSSAHSPVEEIYSIVKYQYSTVEVSWWLLKDNRGRVGDFTTPCRIHKHNMMEC